MNFASLDPPKVGEAWRQCGLIHGHEPFDFGKDGTPYFIGKPLEGQAVQHIAAPALKEPVLEVEFP